MSVLPPSSHLGISRSCWFTLKLRELIKCLPCQQLCPSSFAQPNLQNPENASGKVPHKTDCKTLAEANRCNRRNTSAQLLPEPLACPTGALELLPSSWCLWRGGAQHCSRLTQQKAGLGFSPRQHRRFPASSRPDKGDNQKQHFIKQASESKSLEVQSWVLVPATNPVLTLSQDPGKQRDPGPNGLYLQSSFSRRHPVGHGPWEAF